MEGSTNGRPSIAASSQAESEKEINDRKKKVKNTLSSLKLIVFEEAAKVDPSPSKFRSPGQFSPNKQAFTFGKVRG